MRQGRLGMRQGRLGMRLITAFVASCTFIIASNMSSDGKRLVVSEYCATHAGFMRGTLV